MSQDVSTHQGVREPLSAPPPIQPWSAEAEADKLMDELFSDIDRILDGGSKLPTEPVKPEYISLQPIVIPKITMPAAVVSTQELLQQPSPEDSEAKPVEPLETEIVHSPSPRANRFGWSFEKLLLAVGLASIVGTIFLLLASQKKLTWPGSKNVGTLQSAANRQISDSDKQFVSYALRALDVLDHKTKGKPATPPGSPGGTGTNNSSTIPVPSNRSLNSNQPPTVLERVYIPVPQGRMPMAPPGLPPAARSAAPAPSAAARPAAPAPSVAARPAAPAPSVAARPAAPVPSRAAKPAAPAPSVAAKPAAPAPARAARPAAPVQAVAPASAPPRAATPPSIVQQSSVPPVNNTLVGLVEFGDRPVALINIDGVVQRINIGEGIGNSGWTLVSINKQEAVIRRNGEVRSVYAGQKF